MSSQDAQGPRKLSGRQVMSEAKIPMELLTGPPVPEGVEEGWFLEKDPLFITARIMSDREAERIHWTIFPGKNDPEYRSSDDYLSTLIEVMIENRGPDEVECDMRSDHKFLVITHEDSQRPMEANNTQYKNTAKKRLGKDHRLTEALELYNFPVSPRSLVRKINVFTNFKSTKNLVPEMINKVILGQDILWPVIKRYPPPALAVPQEGIVKMIMGSPRAHDDYDYAILDRGAILRGHNEFGERVEFITDHQARFSLKDGVGFARVTAARSGDLSHMEAGTIGEAYVRARGVDTVTNPLPTWDPGTGPPKGDLPGGSVTRLWSVHLGKREPMVAMAGDTVLAAVNKKLYAFDMEGNVTHDIDIGLLPYYLCIKDPEGPAYIGQDNRVKKVDLGTGKIEDLARVPARIEDMALRADGNLAVLTLGHVLFVVDTDGNQLGAWKVTGQTRVLCARESNNMCSWSGSKVQVISDDGKELANFEDMNTMFDGLALSRTGEHVAFGHPQHRVDVHDLKKEQVASFKTQGLPHAIGFHPKRPLIAVVTRNSYFHLFDIRRGPFWEGKVEGSVGKRITFGTGPTTDLCLFSMMDGHLHLFDLGARSN